MDVTDVVSALQREEITVAFEQCDVATLAGRRCGDGQPSDATADNYQMLIRGETPGFAKCPNQVERSRLLGTERQPGGECPQDKYVRLIRYLDAGENVSRTRIASQLIASGLRLS
jgi:hypothetical protein